ncbi:MAG: sulfotransferase domain-containing protein [Chlamydiae bacterium]|nr:sulfotransferase domain-containing protein [Chlamydiota bacterium]
MTTKPKFFIMLLVLFFNQSLYCKEHLEKFILATQAKSGSHLVLKLLGNLRKNHDSVLFSLNPNDTPYYYPDIIEDSWKQGKLPWTHLYQPHDLNNLFKSTFKNYKVIISIRDIRDVYVSYAHFVHKDPSMTTEEKINAVMKNDLSFYEMNKNLSIFLKNPNFLVVHFEDLVGPQGGGNKEKQTNTIFRIANFIGLPISKKTASQYGDELFGDTGGTFRKGKIGSWKTEMNTDQKMWMKEHFAKELIELGYEKNYHWH